MSQDDDVQASPEGIGSLLDTDLYKLTMQAAILQHYPQTHVTYKFHNRSPAMCLNRRAFDWLQNQVLRLGNLRISDAELAFLRRECAYLPDAYYAWLKDFRMHPAKDVTMTFDAESGALDVHVSGLWDATILYEIPLLALVSEAYFRFVDTDWSHDTQVAQAAEKARQMIAAGCAFSEFGTRRRRDYRTQDLVLRGMTEAGKEAKGTGRLMGTSNVHFAFKYNLKPIGTVAHEWFMGTAAVTGDYVMANKLALTRWRATFGDALGIALTDTFGTNAFLANFSSELAHQYAGVRQDSGSPEAFAGRMVQFYQDRGIDPRTKTVVFSDGLNMKACLALQKLAAELGIGCSFGIGTFLTNDFTRSTDGRPSPAMNIVIKLASANGELAIKISDEVGKHTGDQDLVKRVQKVLREAEQHQLA